MRSNYKKTVLGWIPEDWNLCKFGDIPDQKIKWSLTGGPFGSDLKSSDYTGDKGVRIIQLQNIGDGKFLNTYKIFTSEKKADQLIGCNIYPGELIMSKMGDLVTRTCIIPDYHERYLMASDGIRLVPDNKRFDRKFVLEYINFKTFRNIAVANSTGSTRQRIGLGDLKKLPFICPPLPEQQKIAAILSTWDNAIDNFNKLISEKEQLKKGLMQQLLTGKKRFAGFRDEWKEVKLGKVFEIIGGGTPDTTNDTYWNGDIQWFTPTEIKSKYITKSIRTITISGLAKSSAKLLPVGTLLFTSRATIGDVGIAQIECTTNQGFQSFLPNSSGDISFLYYWVQFNRNEFIRRSSGSTFLEISKKEIEKIKINLPALEEQKRISATLSKSDKEIELLKQELTNLTDQKKGLMQKLLTGEVRVKLDVR